MKEDKKQYETPLIEVIEFSTKNSIAASGVGFMEEIWGGEA